PVAGQRALRKGARHRCGWGDTRRGSQAGNREMGLNRLRAILTAREKEAGRREAELTRAEEELAVRTARAGEELTAREARVVRSEEELAAKAVRRRELHAGGAGPGRLAGGVRTEGERLEAPPGGAPTRA